MQYLHAQLRTKKRTTLLCVLIWLLASLMSLPSLLYSQLEHRNGNNTMCVINFPDHNSENKYDDPLLNRMMYIDLKDLLDVQFYE